MTTIFHEFKRLAFLTLLVSLASIATAGITQDGERFNSSENPHQQFNVSKLNSDKITVTFITTTNVRAVCDAESKKRGYGGFKTSVEACSFWSGSSSNNTCTVVLPTVTNFHTIGHEVRHCMQGDFHK